MKRHIRFIILFCLTVTVATAQVPYHIRGVWKSGAGKQLCLSLLSADDIKGTPIDSTVVAPDGTFVLKGSVQAIGCGMLIDANSKKQEYHIVFFDGSPVELQLKDTTAITGRRKEASVSYQIVKGNKEQEAARQIYQFLSNHFIRSFMGAFAKVALEKMENTPHQTDSLKAEIAQNEAMDKQEINHFFQRYSDCLAAPFFIETNMLREFSGAELQGFFNGLSERVKTSPKGKEVGEVIRKINRLASGSEAPDFTLTTPEGKSISLKGFRGNYVLIDFWASWCAPCLGEMPNLKAIYEEFHSKGLEVIGVSMDNNKTAWTNAIEKEQLPWHHASSLKGMKRCQVAEAYQVLAIPKLYLLDKEGRIITKDLRGKALTEKIKEIIP